MKSIKISKSITPRDSTSLNLYLKDVSHEDMITPEEEVALAKKIKEGDLNARNKLVTANLRFVITVAKQYQGRGLLLEDLIAEGTAGLIKAAEKFDGDKGFKFISYAVWWIRQSILKAIYYTANNIRLPTSQIEPKNKLNKIVVEFEQMNGRKPSEDELSDISGFTVDFIKGVQAANNRCVSIDAPSIDDSEDCTIGDCIPNPNSDSPSDTTNNSLIRDGINSVLDDLNNRDHDIICMFYGLNGCNEMTYAEIARKFNLSAERIRQIHHSLLKSFRSTYKDKFKRLV